MARRPGSKANATGGIRSFSRPSFVMRARAIPTGAAAMDSERKLTSTCARRRAQGQKAQLRERVAQLGEKSPVSRHSRIQSVQREFRSSSESWQACVIFGARIWSQINRPDGARAARPPGSTVSAVNWLPPPRKQRQGRRDRAANPANRSGHRQRSRQGIARGRRQDRRVRRAQGDRGRSAQAHRHPRPQDEPSFNCRFTPSARHHSQRSDHADRAEADNLAVEVKVNPQDIDQLQLNQKPSCASPRLMRGRRRRSTAW